MMRYSQRLRADTKSAAKPAIKMTTFRTHAPELLVVRIEPRMVAMPVAIPRLPRSMSSVMIRRRTG